MKSVNSPIPKKLPFFFDATVANDNGGFPKILPFKLNYDRELNMYRQIGHKRLNILLKKAYLKGSMLSGGMNDVVIGKLREIAAFDFILKNMPTYKNLRILEIGCGEGQVLKRLAKKGVTCMGLEPGPQAQKIKENNLSVVQDFFPSKKINGKFDLILHLNVMEHINNPVRFLEKQKELLTERGLIICAFPNCEPDLEAGDISLFLHEHFNYFTRNSIVKIAERAGLFIDKIEDNKIERLLFVAMKLKQNNRNGEARYPKFTSIFFETKAQQSNKAITDFFEDVNQNEVATYCPLRAMNPYYLLKILSSRLVDDNPNLHDKYLPTFNHKIENFEQLIKNPPKKILIYSRTFGKEIKKKCLKEKSLKNTEVKTIDELL